MKRIILPALLILLTVITGCNMPAANLKSMGYARQTATADAMNQMVRAALSATESAEAAVLPTEEEPEMLISKNDSAADPAPVPPEEPTPVPLPTADPNRVPPELPAVFQTSELNKLDTPHTYEEDVCKMIKNRWGEGKAAPGTVVMAIMYHSIVRGESVNQDNAITVTQHQQLIRDLHDQGFTAINTEQFIAFIENNDWIPERSVLLIVDDRHSEENYITHFKDYYDEWGWPVINAWISAEGTTQELWDGNAHAEEIGLVDHQAHGVVHNIPMGDDSTDEYLIGELKGSVDQIEAHFHKTPRAIIWPGGGFGARAIEVAKEYGYKVGFTTHPRGPIMYNWVPLCDVNDPSRPYYKLDGNMDPLFVLPRYWDTDAVYHIDTVRQIGKDARDYLYSIRETEVEYYDIVCRPIMGDL